MEAKNRIQSFLNLSRPATVIFLEKKYSLNGLSQARGSFKKKFTRKYFFQSNTGNSFIIQKEPHCSCLYIPPLSPLLDCQYSTNVWPVSLKTLVSDIYDYQLWFGQLHES